jgi:hypothetical protein
MNTHAGNVALTRAASASSERLFHAGMAWLLVVVAVVGIVCSWLPARRARKANVATLLRVE